MGTMTYQKSQDGKSWATVDVDIKQVPHLRRIIYRNPEQTDDNAEFNGCAYYRFGDVVSRDIRNKDGSTTREYWVCVRPAFGPEKKQDSHWVCVNALPQKNIASYSYTFDKKDPAKRRTETWYVPTDLGMNELHMQNLAEMLFAMLNPEEWETNVTSKDKPKLKMFNDFNRQNVDFHNQYFWGNVSKKWDEIKYEDADGKKSDLWHLVFNASKYMMEEQVNNGNNGLHLLHDGYSWWWRSSWYCKLWETIYTRGTGNTSNMHAVSGTITRENSMEKIKFDCHQMGSIGSADYMEFFGTDNPQLRWTIRHATGSDLVAKGGKYNERSQIKGVTDVYRYYRDVNKVDDLFNTQPERTSANDKDGDGMKDPKEEEQEGVDGIDYASNAPTEGSGTYMIGDVLEDEQHRRYFCIQGSPHNSAEQSFITDHTAWFISFDDNLAAPGYQPAITEEELPLVTARYAYFLQNVRNITSHTEYKLNLATGKLGLIGQHILDYAKVDLRKTVGSVVDSTWKFTNYRDKKEYASNSRSFVFSIGYKPSSGVEGKNAIARFVFDNTQCGDNRNCSTVKSGRTLSDWHLLLYKHYEQYDPQKITLTDDEESIKMNKWQVFWPMTDDMMYLEDVTSQDMVDKYAPGDKWQKTNRRTKAAAKVAREDCQWRDGNFVNDQVTIFNEPVIYMRVIKITDNGGKRPNLVAQDGTKLKVVHLQNDAVAYQARLQSLWALNFSVDMNDAFFVDNKVYQIPPLPGF